MTPFSPFLCFCVLMYTGVADNKKLLLIFFCIFALFFVPISLLYVPPSDNLIYLGAVNATSNILEAVFNGAYNTAVMTSIYWLLLKIVPMPVCAALVNALLLSACIIICLKIFAVKRASGLFITLLSIIFLLTPTISLSIGITINKDGVITYTLISFFYYYRNAFINNTNGYSIRKNLLLFIFAVIVLLYMRTYFIFILVLAGGLAFIFNLQKNKLHLSMPLAHFFTCLIMIFFLTLILFYSYPSMTKNWVSYIGAATFNIVYNFPRIDSIALAFLGIFVAYWSIFSDIFIQNIGFLKALVGSYQIILLLLSIAFFYLSALKDKMRTFIWFFILVQLPLQVWATPNLGALLRETVFIYEFSVVYLLTCFFTSKRSNDNSQH